MASKDSKQEKTAAPLEAPSRLCSRQAAAERLALSVDTLDEMRFAGLLHTYHVGPTGAAVRLDMDEVDRYIVANREPTRLEIPQRGRRCH